MKRRSLTVLLCLLAIISLASVGFASWVISASDDVEATGSIVVEKVTDERVMITELKFDEVEYVDEKTVLPSFTFGKSSATTTHDWLKNDTQEHLQILISFKVIKKADNSEIKSTDDVKLSVVFGLVEGYSFAVDGTEGKVYAEIVEPTAIVYNPTEGRFECTIALKWGNYIGDVAGENPFEYYNNRELSDELASDAKDKLGKMYSALNAVRYAVTITAEPKPASAA